MPDVAHEGQTRWRSGVARRLFGTPPFDRQAHVHILSTAADTFVAVSLAGSLFFSVSVDAARPRIVLYLLLTMAPFAVVAPLIGPVIDRFRGGHRLVLVLVCAGRAGLCLLLARDLRNLLFYPEVFAVLVLGKTYSVAKSSLVPRLVPGSEDLVAANSLLSRVGAIGGAVGGAVAVGMSLLGGAPLVLWGAAAVFLAAAVVAARLPRAAAAPPEVPRGIQYEELHTPAVLIDSVAMALMRGAVGFLAFLLAFGLKSAGEPVWFFGVVIAAGGLGGFAGTFVAPVLRGRFPEERLLSVSLVVPAVLALYAGAAFDWLGVVAVSLVLGISANVATQAFSSLLQRHAPEADRGRAFATFETRFQLAWVGGALLPVMLSLPPWLGLLLLGMALTAGAVVHELGSRARRSAEERWAASGALARAGAVGRPMLDDAERFRSEGDHARAVLTALAAVRAASDAGATEETATARFELEGIWRQILADQPVSEAGLAHVLALADDALAQLGESGTGTSSGSPTTRQASPDDSTTTR